MDDTHERACSGIDLDDRSPCFNHGPHVFVIDRDLSRASIWNYERVTVHPAGLELLHLHRRTVFSFDSRGLMVHENDPRKSRGKRFSMTGCSEGNLIVIRDDVSELASRALERLAANEPPLSGHDSTPRGLHDYLSTLGEEEQVNAGLFGYLWTFPKVVPSTCEAKLVISGSIESARLLERWVDTMPEALVERGFRKPADLWEPWCVAVVANKVASIAQTVRTGSGGAEVGVDTAPEFRGRGLAAGSTAGWSRHPALAGVTLFYSASRTNESSSRVTDRLGLTFVGSTFAIS